MINIALLAGNSCMALRVCNSARKKKPTAGTPSRAPQSPVHDLVNTPGSLPDPNLAVLNLTPESNSDLTIQAAPAPAAGQYLHAQNFFLAQPANTLSTKTPLWARALSIFEGDYGDEYQVLETSLANLTSDSAQNFLSLVDLPTPERLQKQEDNVQHEFIKRMRQYLPSLTAVRGAVTAFARLDPHLVAPYNVTGSFFVIDVRF
jgi:hypothetical protein